MRMFVRRTRAALQRVARTAALAVRVLSLEMSLTPSYSSAVSRLRRPFLSDGYFFITVRLLRRRGARVALTCFVGQRLFVFAPFGVARGRPCGDILDK